MATKQDVVNDYAKTCRDKYGHLETPACYNRRILVTGVSKLDTNIGCVVAERLSASYGEVDTLSKSLGDLGDPDFVKSVSSWPTRYDTLVCCHGTTYLDWIEKQTSYTISRQLNDTLASHILVTNQFVKDTIDLPYKKHIVYIGSMAYRQVLNGSSVYCAAKAGLNMFARCVAWELAPKGYDVFILHPGNVINTPMARSTMLQLQRYRNIDACTAISYWNAGNPRTTILTMQEIADRVAELIDGKHTYLAGNPIDLAGGQR